MIDIREVIDIRKVIAIREVIDIREVIAIREAGSSRVNAPKEAVAISLVDVIPAILLVGEF